MNDLAHRHAIRCKSSGFSKPLGMKLIYNLVEKLLKGTIAIDKSSGTLFKIIFKEGPNDSPLMGADHE